MTDEPRFTFLEKRVRRLNLLLGLLALAVVVLGLRVIVWVQESDGRLRVAEAWENYWYQRVNEETTTPKGK